MKIPPLQSRVSLPFFGRILTLEYALGSEHQAVEALEGHHQELQEVQDNHHQCVGLVREVCGGGKKVSRWK